MQLGLFERYKTTSTLDDITATLERVTDSVSRSIPTAQKSALSQYFTNIMIAKQMASMVSNKDISRIGDHGAGTGILSATLIAMKEVQRTGDTTPIHVKAYEIDQDLHATISDNLNLVSDFRVGAGGTAVEVNIDNDFTDIAAKVLSGNDAPQLTTIVLNPPYKKLNQQTYLAKLFRSNGVSVPNLYAAFIVLSVLMLKPGGELVAIVPRSFCNGDYFKSFRKWLLNNGSIDWLIRYKRRSNAFRRDCVLQENLVFRYTRSKPQTSTVRVSLCETIDDEPSFSGLLKSSDVIKTDCGTIFVPGSNQELSSLHEIMSYPASFSDCDFKINTGKLEDFRMVDHLHHHGHFPDYVPVLYTQHWDNAETNMQWHDNLTKKCYLRLNEFTIKKCIPAGRYILIKRISANDDRTGRCHPCLVTEKDIPGSLWAIDNHIQVLSVPQELSDDAVITLTSFLTSTTVNNFFKVISGTTQLNCNDIRKLRFPTRYKSAQTIESGV